MSKIEKTIARQKQKVDEGQYYEAHQQLRVIASRYSKQNNYNAVTDLLFEGSQMLLKAGQGASGSDLAMLLMENLNTGEIKPGAAVKGQLLTLLRTFPPEEPTKKRFVDEMISWSAKTGDFPAGDPELHDVAGRLFAEDWDPYEAEKHLVLGTRDSVNILTQLEYSWFVQDEPHTAGQYASRAVLPLLLVGNLRGANQSLLLFTSRLAQEHAALGSQEVSTSNNDVRIYPSVPLLNFIGLLLMTVQRGDSADAFRNLRNHYAPHIREIGSLDEALDQIGEMYFNIKKVKQGNPLFDMMGSFFGGGGGSSGVADSGRSGRSPAPAPAVD